MNYYHTNPVCKGSQKHTHTHTHTHTHMHTCTEAHKQIHTNTHIFIAHPIANIMESVNFWKSCKKSTFQQYQSLMNTRKHWRIRLTSSIIPCPWFSVPCRPEKNCCQINRCMGRHITSFLACQTASTTL
jgi:hypothetical protein